MNKFLTRRCLAIIAECFISLIEHDATIYHSCFDWNTGNWQKSFLLAFALSVFRLMPSLWARERGTSVMEELRT
jgi:hypothetical protein